MAVVNYNLHGCLQIAGTARPCEHRYICVWLRTHVKITQLQYGICTEYSLQPELVLLQVFFFFCDVLILHCWSDSSCCLLFYLRPAIACSAIVVYLSGCLSICSESVDWSVCQLVCQFISLSPIPILNIWLKICCKGHLMDIFRACIQCRTVHVDVGLWFNTRGGN